MKKNKNTKNYKLVDLLLCTAVRISILQLYLIQIEVFSTVLDDTFGRSKALVIISFNYIKFMIVIHY
jgi:hypothetical protein